jgi:acetyl esterase/lipase
MHEIEMVAAMPDLSDTLSFLASSGASWQSPKTIKVGERKSVVRTLSGIRYNGATKEDNSSSYIQSLDITFPSDRITPSATEPPIKKPLPVFIFIHGGGWSRGGKDSRFYGAPSICENIAASPSGCIAVAPGYRLGTYPHFMYDAAAAIRWIRDNIVTLGGDLTSVFLGGHSAGGHIASLLLLRHADFLQKVDIPLDFFRGLILVSGVYDLFCPLKKAALDAKNKTFVLAYVIPAFGSDERVRRNASPLLLLNPNKDTSVLGGVAMSLISSLSPSKTDSLICSEKEQGQVDKDFVDKVKVNTSFLPRTLILNASFDMGLQENGKLMADAMAQHTSVEYRHIPWTDHASICWNEKTYAVLREFMAI